MKINENQRKSMKNQREFIEMKGHPREIDENQINLMENQRRSVKIKENQRNI